MRASRSSISSSWSSHVRSISGRDITARWALCIFSLMSVAAVATCWISRGPSAGAVCEVGSAGGTSMMRLRSLWRSGRMSKVVGGGRPGEAEEAGGRACMAGVAEPVGGSEARADAGAWGVAAPDMKVKALQQTRSWASCLYLCLCLCLCWGWCARERTRSCPRRRADQAPGDWLCETLVTGASRCLFSQHRW